MKKTLSEVQIVSMEWHIHLMTKSRSFVYWEENNISWGWGLLIALVKKKLISPPLMVRTNDRRHMNQIELPRWNLTKLGTLVAQLNVSSAWFRVILGKSNVFNVMSYGGDHGMHVNVRMDIVKLICMKYNLVSFPSS